jgi:asparagine synthase (glutamine-hydrolysing)
MCGLGGYSLSTKEIFLENILSEVIKKIIHRGPDHQGLYENKNFKIGLAHTRLSIQDISSNGHQPMISEDKKVVLVYNGEIYNFEDLRLDLKKKGKKFKSNSDTEVLLNLYLTEGQNMLSKLDGIFAFAIWDQRDRSLFLARDHFGVKPLYYTTEKENFFFASEIKGLFPFLKKNKNLNYDALNRYLTYLWCPGKETSLKSVYKLLPGEALIVSEGKIKKRWKWYTPSIFKQNPKKIMNKESAIKDTHDYLRKAVYRQMVSDVPVGAFLSGGLDSSAVVAFAREKNKNIHCFTIESNGHDKGDVDDLPYARKVAKHLSVPLDVVKVNPKKIADNIENMIKILDEPIADPAALNVLYISQLARKNGIKVLLSGAGGDDLFTGYRRHNALMHEYLWSWLPLKVKSLISKTSLKISQKSNFYRRITKILKGIEFEGDDRIINYFTWNGTKDLENLFTSDFKYLLKNADASSTMKEHLKKIPEKISKLDRMLSLEQQFFLADHNLVYTDRMSMAVGVEVRVPFLDRELVEFAYNVPDQYKQRGTEGKWVLKKALKSYLPNDIIYRPKTGFGVPLRRWMKNELHEILCDTLSFKNLNNRGLFDPKAVWKLIENNDKGKIDASYTLFSLLCIEIWCRNYIKN